MINTSDSTVCSIKLGRCVLHIRLFHRRAVSQFQDFLVETDDQVDIICTGTYEKEQYLEQFQGSPWNAYAEYKCLLNLASDAMMPQNQLLFHSAAVLIHDRVWLLSGASGIGKTTQYRNLKELHPDDVEIISGDNPVLSFEKDGIMVYPSPWNGKENYRSMKTGKLAGIVLLKQEKANAIQPMNPADAVVPAYHEINTYAKTEEQIHLLASLEERLITTVPVWTFGNTGDLQSSEMLYQHFLKQ